MITIFDIIYYLKYLRYIIVHFATFSLITKFINDNFNTLSCVTTNKVSERKSSSVVYTDYRVYIVKEVR